MKFGGIQDLLDISRLCIDALRGGVADTSRTGRYNSPIQLPANINNNLVLGPPLSPAFPEPTCTRSQLRSTTDIAREVGIVVILDLPVEDAALCLDSGRVRRSLIQSTISGPEAKLIAFPFGPSGE